MDKPNQDLAKKAGAAFAEAMASVFSMLTGRDFAIVAEEGASRDPQAVLGFHSETAVLVKAHYTKGLSGILLFALPLKEGTMLVDLMLGGDGAPAAELAGDSRDALAETFNQSMGSANQTLSEQAGETLSISNVEIFSVPPGDAAALEAITGAGPFLDIPLGTAQDSLKTTIHVLLPEPLAAQLRRKLGLEAEAEPAPVKAAPAAAPAPVPAAAQPTVVATRASMPSPMAAPVDQGNLDLLLDIELPLMVRMGQTEMQLGELLKLTPGSILELNRAADAPVELLVNNKQIAKGEVVVVDGNFAFRITEIESPAARIRSLG